MAMSGAPVGSFFISSSLVPNGVNNDGMTVGKAVVFSANLIKVLRAFCHNLYFQETRVGSELKCMKCEKDGQILIQYSSIWTC